MPGGERGIRTPGPVTVNGFQDRRIRPLCHLSAAKIRAGRVSSKTSEKKSHNLRDKMPSLRFISFIHNRIYEVGGRENRPYIYNQIDSYEN